MLLWKGFFLNSCLILKLFQINFQTRRSCIFLTQDSPQSVKWRDEWSFQQVLNQGVNLFSSHVPGLIGIAGIILQKHMHVHTMVGNLWNRHMIYLQEFMIKLLRPIITIGLGLVLAFSSAALSSSGPRAIQGNLGATAFLLQTTPTPQPKDLSKIGSTDGITAMGFLIALIIIIPILLRRKSWMQIQ